jgi:hypothetical protein
MKTRKVKVTRTMTLTRTVTMEIPDEVTNEALSDAINDQGSVFDLIDCTLFGMTEEEDETKVADYIPDNGRVSEDLSLDQELREALENDKLI